jgi:hypothetical protein
VRARLDPRQSAGHPRSVKELESQLAVIEAGAGTSLIT